MGKKQYRHFNEAEEELNLIVHTVYEMPEEFENENLEFPFAFVTRNGLSTNSYKIYISNYCHGDMFLLHEMGHIICQHLRYEEIIHEQIMERLKAVWTRAFGKYFSKCTDHFAHLLCNYAMDMEVNTRFFDVDEKPAMIRELVSSEWDRRKVQYQRHGLKKSIRRSDLSKEGISPVFPEDYGFERNLTWRKYIDLMLLNPDMFAFILYENFKKQGVQISSDGKVSEKEIERITENHDTTEGIGNKLSEYEKNIDKGNDKGKGSRKDFLSQIQKIGPETADFIRERSVADFKDTRTDYLYLTNRGKTYGVLRGKSVDHNDYMMKNIYVIVDTSGSVDSENLRRLLSLFTQLKAFVGEQSKVIFWDTELQNVCPLRKKITAIPRGAGTNIAKAIEYVRQKHCRTNDAVFIISDYFDNLDDWLTEINKLPCTCYGICWTFEDAGKTIESTFAANSYFATRYGKKIKEFCSKVETLFVSFNNSR